MDIKVRKFVFFMMVIFLAASFSWAEGTKEVTQTAPASEVVKEFTYPEEPITLLIPFGAGGSADLMGRALANPMDNILGQPVVPINKPGAGGGIMYSKLVKSKNDGYTVGWNSTSILTATNMGNVPFMYDAFDHVCRIGYTSMPIAVSADAPWDTIEELAAWAKANPGTLKIGNAGTGSGTHLTAVMFENAAEIKVIHVPLGAQRRVPSLLGGEVEAICVPLPEAAHQALGGAIKILAVSTGERDPSFPEIPTFIESGFDVDIALFRGISMPKGTDKAILAKLEAAFKKASETVLFKSIATKNGFLVSFLGSADFEKYLADQNKRINAAMKAGGLID